MSAETDGTSAAPVCRLGVFLSYSHDSDTHKEKVLSLAERLRQDGVDAQIDQYVNGTPDQGWPRWMLDKLDEAAFVLVVCTEAYYRRFRGHEVSGRGRGVDWEGALITQELYNTRSSTIKFVPVQFTAYQCSFIPEPLRGHTHYELTSEEAYQTLYRFLLGRAAVSPRPLGDLRQIPMQEAKPLTFAATSSLSIPDEGRPGPDYKLRKRSPSVGERTPARRRQWMLSVLPSALLLLLVGLSTSLHVRTRVQLDFATTRLAVTLGGMQYREILDSSAPFSSLLIEGCNSAAFTAETLQIADPWQLIPATMAGETPRFPSKAWRTLTSAGLLKLSCEDPAAKLSLQSPVSTDSPLGTLGHIRLAPGSLVILSVSPGREHSLSLETGTPQRLAIPLDRDLELVAEFVTIEGIAYPFPGDLKTWRARLPESHRIFELISDARGLTLIVTPARGRALDLFRESLNFPLTSLELLEESLRGDVTSSLRDVAKLTYPDYPDVPAVAIEPHEDLGLGRLSQAQLTHLSFDVERGTLQVGFDGIAERPTSKAGEFVRDHRLTLFHAVRYSRRWALIAVAAAWLASTTWVAYEAWKKLQE